MDGISGVHGLWKKKENQEGFQGDKENFRFVHKWPDLRNRVDKEEGLQNNDANGICT